MRVPHSENECRQDPDFTNHTTKIFHLLDTTLESPSTLYKSISQDIMAKETTAPTIGVKDLTFAFPDGSTGLRNISLDLPGGSRTLLIGGKHSSHHI